MTIRPSVAIGAALAWAVGLGAVVSAGAQQLKAISSRADMVSGGDVLISLIDPPGGAWTARLGARDVTAAFKPAGGGTERRALLTGLPIGANALTIASGGRTLATLELVNHPLAGPLFSGPHQVPFICQTQANGLGPALDRDCYAKTIVAYYYKAVPGTAGEPIPPGTPGAEPAAGKLMPGFKPYPTSGPRPTDVAKTTTTAGRTVDYIVRRELGVINRGVYEIQFLHRPGDPLPSPWARPAGAWNGRLVYRFGAGCRPGYRQAALSDPIGAVQEPLVGQGYAIAASSLSSFENDCNDRISAESMAMVKEHFIEEFGEPVHTIGFGGSGGAMQVQMTVQNYPGLLDGIISMANFVDPTSFVQGVTDCQLLDRAWRAMPAWSEVQKTATYGGPTWRFCTLLGAPRTLRVVDPTVCDPVVPNALAYDPVKNRKGARCDIFSTSANLLGRDPETGFTRRPLDNVGVQYGFAAFTSGVIDAEQFVDLNERIGGFDLDGNLVAARTEADTETVRLAYERGLMVTGGGDLGSIPIIDWRAYSDDLGIQDGHSRYLSFVARARIEAATGRSDNQVMLVNPREDLYNWRPFLWYPIGTLVPPLDRWLDAIAADGAPGSRAEKVVRNRPKDLEEGCTTVGGERIAERATYGGSGRCDRMYPAYANARIAAGGPIADDVIKCSLKPIDPAEYPKPLSDSQLQRLRAVFPTGVCDYSRPAVGHTVTKERWQRF